MPALSELQAIFEIISSTKSIQNTSSSSSIKAARHSTPQSWGIRPMTSNTSIRSLGGLSNCPGSAIRGHPAAAGKSAAPSGSETFQTSIRRRQTAFSRPISPCSTTSTRFSPRTSPSSADAASSVASSPSGKGHPFFSELRLTPLPVSISRKTIRRASEIASKPSVSQKQTFTASISRVQHGERSIPSPSLPIQLRASPPMTS